MSNPTFTVSPRFALGEFVFYRHYAGNDRIAFEVCQVREIVPRITEKGIEIRYDLRHPRDIHKSISESNLFSLQGMMQHIEGLSSKLFEQAVAEKPLPLYSDITSWSSLTSDKWPI